MGPAGTSSCRRLGGALDGCSSQVDLAFAEQPSAYRQQCEAPIRVTRVKPLRERSKKGAGQPAGPLCAVSSPPRANGSRHADAGIADVDRGPQRQTRWIALTPDDQLDHDHPDPL